MSQQINLFNPIFLKQKKHFSAATMAQALGLILLGCVILSAYVSYRVNVRAAEAQHSRSPQGVSPRRLRVRGERRREVDARGRRRRAARGPGQDVSSPAPGWVPWQTPRSAPGADRVQGCRGWYPYCDASRAGSAPRKYAARRRHISRMVRSTPCRSQRRAEVVTRCRRHAGRPRRSPGNPDTLVVPRAGEVLFRLR